MLVVLGFHFRASNEEVCKKNIEEITDAIETWSRLHEHGSNMVDMKTLVETNCLDEFLFCLTSGEYIFTEHRDFEGVVVHEVFCRDHEFVLTPAA
jgi:hypothetical protein